MNTSPTSANGTYHVIPVPRLQSFTVLSLAQTNGETSFASATPQINALSLPSLRAREEAEIRKLKEQELKRGKNVTQEAQEIFNALTRTMPGRWDGQDMVISDNVKISKPYRTDDCKPVDDSVSGAAVHRVRKVVSRVAISEELLLTGQISLKWRERNWNCEGQASISEILRLRMRLELRM